MPQLQVAGRDGADEPGLQPVAPVELLAQGGVEDLRAPAAADLGAVDRDVGLHEDPLGVHGTVLRDRHADARADADLAAAGQDQRLGEGGDQPFRDGDGGRLLVDGLEEHDELVPAEPRDHVARPHALLHEPAAPHQHLVPGRVPEGVVHLLEAVEVDEQQSHERAAALGPAERTAHQVRGLGPVGQPGQAVVRGLVRQREARDLALLVRGLDLVERELHPRDDQPEHRDRAGHDGPDVEPPPERGLDPEHGRRHQRGEAEGDQAGAGEATGSGLARPVSATIEGSSAAAPQVAYESSQRKSSSSVLPQAVRFIAVRRVSATASSAMDVTSSRNDPLRPPGVVTRRNSSPTSRMSTKGYVAATVAASGASAYEEMVGRASSTHPSSPSAAVTMALSRNAAGSRRGPRPRMSSARPAATTP